MSVATERSWLDAELRRVFDRGSVIDRGSRIAPPITVQVASSGTVAQYAVNSHAASAYTTHALTDEDVRRLERPQEFPCEHGIPILYCARCSSGKP